MRSLFLTGFLMTSASLFASTGPIEAQDREVVVDNVQALQQAIAEATPGITMRNDCPVQLSGSER